MPYDVNEPIQNKSLWIIDESVANSGDSFDKLKGELQALWTVHEDTENEPSLYMKSPSLNLDPGAERTIELQDLRDITTVRINSPGSYVKSAEFNPTKVSRISDSLILPNFQIPLRLYGDPTKIHSDSHWEAILMGTSYKGEKTDRLIDMNSLFYDTAVRIPLPYALSEINSSYGAGGYPASVTNRIQVTNEYNHYSQTVKRYQDRIGKYGSETLIPSVYFFETIYCAPQLVDETDNDVFYALQAQLGSASLNRAIHQGTDDTLTTSVRSARTSILQETRITGSGAFRLHAQLDKMSYLTISPSDEAEIMKQNKNLLFTSEFYESRDPIVGTHGELLAREFPYYNKIAFQRHVGLSPIDVLTEAFAGADPAAVFSSMATTAREQFGNTMGSAIAEGIEHHEASSIFLESLKNLVLDEFSDFKMTEKSYKTFTVQEEFEGAHSTFRRYPNGIDKSQTYRQVDLLSFLTYVISNLTDAVSDDTTTLGPINYGRGLSAAWESHTSGTGAARFASAGPLAQLIPATVTRLLQMSGWVEPYEWAQSTYSAELSDGSSLGMMELQQALYDVFFIQNSRGGYKEVIAYRIEKIGGSTTQDQTTATSIQNFWIFNSTHAPEELEFYDSQVKYGEEYTYNIYAYLITQGQRYKYTDFAISRTEQKLTINPEETDPSLREDRYYLSFFDPITNQRADQTFFDGRGKRKNFAREQLVSMIPEENQPIFTNFLEAFLAAEPDFWPAVYPSDVWSVFNASGLSEGVYTTNMGGPLPTSVSHFRSRLVMYIYRVVADSYDYNTDSKMALFLETLESDAWKENSYYEPWSPAPSTTEELITVAESVGINDSPLARLNEAARSPYALSNVPYLADCRVLVEPCLKLIEIPLYSKALRLYDNPANGITINPFQYLDQSNNVGYDIGYDGFKVDMVYPDAISEEDMTVKADYLHAKDYITEDIKESLSPQRYVEVYRIDHKPVKYSEFATGLVATIDLKIPNSQYCQVKTLFTNKVEANKKYYFLFRFVNELGMPGHLSQILETELINDGGYTYAKFGTLAEAEMEVNDHIEVMSPFKKIIQITPSMAQLQLDDSNVDYTRTATQGLLDLAIGINATSETSDSIWGDTFKIRLVSKKTGKKIDLNITYALTDENPYRGAGPGASASHASTMPGTMPVEVGGATPGAAAASAGTSDSPPTYDVGD